MLRVIMAQVAKAASPLKAGSLPVQGAGRIVVDTRNSVSWSKFRKSAWKSFDKVKREMHNVRKVNHLGAAE